MPRATCRCGQKLTLPVNGPDRVICPKCSAKIRVRQDAPKGRSRRRLHPLSLPVRPSVESPRRREHADGVARGQVSRLRPNRAGADANRLPFGAVEGEGPQRRDPHRGTRSRGFHPPGKLGGVASRPRRRRRDAPSRAQRRPDDAARRRSRHREGRSRPPRLPSLRPADPPQRRRLPRMRRSRAETLRNPPGITSRWGCPSPLRCSVFSLLIACLFPNRLENRARRSPTPERPALGAERYRRCFHVSAHSMCRLTTATSNSRRCRSSARGHRGRVADTRRAGTCRPTARASRLHREPRVRPDARQRSQRGNRSEQCKA